jgi:hypothetical protein
MNSTSYAALTAESRLGVVFDGPLRITAAVSAEPYVGYTSPDGKAFLASALPVTLRRILSEPLKSTCPALRLGLASGLEWICPI